MYAPQLFHGTSAEVGVADAPTVRVSTTGATPRYPIEHAGLLDHAAERERRDDEPDRVQHAVHTAARRQGCSVDAMSLLLIILEHTIEARIL